MEYKDGFLINVQYAKQILAESVLYVEHFFLAFRIFVLNLFPFLSKANEFFPTFAFKMLCKECNRRKSGK